MPPGQTIPKNLSWAAAKEVCSAHDMERLACAFLNATEAVQFDADKAAKDFGGGKGDSFKRGIWVITKKIKEHIAAANGGGDEHDPNDSAVATPVKAKAKPGRKRKATVEGDGEGDGESQGPTPKKRGGGRKAAIEVQVKAESVAEPASEPTIQPTFQPAVQPANDDQGDFFF